MIRLGCIALLSAILVSSSFQNANAMVLTCRLAMKDIQQFRKKRKEAARLSAENRKGKIIKPEFREEFDLLHRSELKKLEEHELEAEIVRIEAIQNAYERRLRRFDRDEIRNREAGREEVGQRLLALKIYRSQLDEVMEAKSGLDFVLD